MRELLFKNLTSQDARRRILSVSEKIYESGMEITTQKRCSYQVKNRIHINSLANFNAADEIQKMNGYQETKGSGKRRFYIIRKHDSRTNENKLFCKVNGSLYIVKKDYLYQIGFAKHLKIGMKAVK